jgi:hypothetical protein
MIRKQPWSYLRSCGGIYWKGLRETMKNLSHDSQYVASEVLTVVVMKNTVFWVIIPCGPLKVNQSFWGT